MSEHANIAKALIAFQAEMPTVAKGKSATVRSDKGSYSYTYAGLAEVSHAALPLLTKHGLSFSCTPEILERGPVLTGILLHESGEALRGSLPLATGGTPQQTGSAITYARRYLFGCMTGLVTDDDDDGQLAQGAAKRTATKPKATPPPAPTADVPMTAKTRAHLFALFGEHNISDEDEQRRGINAIIMREEPILSRSELTEAEARKVIAVLDARPRPGAGAE